MSENQRLKAGAPDAFSSASAGFSPAFSEKRVFMRSLKIALISLVLAASMSFAQGRARGGAVRGGGGFHSSGAVRGGFAGGRVYTGGRYYGGGYYNNGYRPGFNLGFGFGYPAYYGPAYPYSDPYYYDSYYNPYDYPSYYYSRPAVVPRVVVAPGIVVGGRWRHFGR
jgi:hypothetical protein